MIRMIKEKIKKTCKEQQKILKMVAKHEKATITPPLLTATKKITNTKQN